MSGWTCLSNTEVKARKEYKCCLCGLRIRKGAKYIRRTGVDEGVVTMRMHAVCEDASKKWDVMDWETGTDEIDFRRLDLGMTV